MSNQLLPPRDLLASACSFLAARLLVFGLRFFGLGPTGGFTRMFKRSFGSFGPRQGNLYIFLFIVLAGSLIFIARMVHDMTAHKISF